MVAVTVVLVVFAVLAGIGYRRDPNETTQTLFLGTGILAGIFLVLLVSSLIL